MKRKVVAKAERPRGTGMLFKQPGCQFWYVQYYIHSKKIRVSTHETDPKKAEAFLKDRLAEVRTDTHKDTRKTTYLEMRDRYYQHYKVQERKSLRYDKDGNFKPLDKVVRLDNFFLGFLASEIGTDLIEKFIACEQKRGISNASINRSVASLRRMFRLAKRAGQVKDIPSFLDLYQKEATPRQGFLEREEYAKLFPVLPAHLK